MEIFKYFSQNFLNIFHRTKTFDISYKETICMKFQSLFSEKNRKNIVNLSSVELVQWVVKINPL